MLNEETGTTCGDKGVSIEGTYTEQSVMVSLASGNVLTLHM